MAGLGTVRPRPVQHEVEDPENASEKEESGWEDFDDNS